MSPAEAKVRAWGYPHVFTWSDAPYEYLSISSYPLHPTCVPTTKTRSPTNQTVYEPRNAHYPPHTHRVATTHLILDGTLTIAYPSDKEERKGEEMVERVEWGKGARIDVPAGRVHEVWVGEEGCRYVIGEGERGG